MAGIGWRLERLMEQGSLGATAAAYATGASVMALPWILTTAVLCTLPMAIREPAVLATAGVVVEVAHAVALLVCGPVQVVVSRLSADRLYEGRLDAIAAPFHQSLALTLVLCAISAAAMLRALGLPAGLPLWCGSALAAAVGAQWTALAVGNGLCSPGLVMGSVVLGAASSFGFAVAGARFSVEGYLLGLTLGQCVTLTVLMAAIGRALPETCDEDEAIWPAFRNYALLAAAGFAFNAALWIDKFVVRLVADSQTAAFHSTGSIIAWLATVPCLAWIFVEVETTFQRSVQEFYVSLESGATLSELDACADRIRRDVARLFRGALLAQAGATLFAQLAAPRIVSALGLPPGAVIHLRLLLVVACGQAVALVGLLALYFFDLRGDALRTAATLLVAVTALTAAASWLHLTPAVGTAAGCAIGAVTAVRLASRGARQVLQHALMGPTFGGE
jgi:uncharacterized membrane protein